MYDTNQKKVGKKKAFHGLKILFKSDFTVNDASKFFVTLPISVQEVGFSQRGARRTMEVVRRCPFTTKNRWFATYG